MYNEVKCFCISCDNCEETFIDPYTDFSIFVDKNTANEHLDNSEWYHGEGKHYCPNCHEIDDEDNLIIKSLIP